MTFARQMLEVHVHQAGVLQELAGGPLVAARLAYRLGEPELARALLARTGGLFDLPESQRLLNETCPQPLLVKAREALPARASVPKWSDTQQEMYVRVLASLLVTDSPPQTTALGGSSSHWKAGLWHLPAQLEQPRWKTTLHLIQESQVSVRWATASWGGRWGLQRQLNDKSLNGQVELISLEHVMNALNAAWRWDLPELAELLTCPLLIEGLETLPPERLDVLTTLLSDASTLFDWSVVALPGFELRWPDQYQPMPLQASNPETDAEAAEETGAQVPLQQCTAGPVLLLPRQHPVPLQHLADELREQSGRTLVVLYSRASAARLAGLLPGSVLLSSSLSRVHQAERMTELAEQHSHDPALTVIATTLPSTAMGLFDHVWHLNAPLPYLIEAAQLSRATFRILDLSDVAVPQQWSRQLQVTNTLLAQGDALNDRALQRLYFEELRASERRNRAALWLELRRDMQFASLASEMNAQSDSSVPVLIPRDDAGRQVIEHYRQQRWLPRQGLRHAAWLTVSEARRAVQRGEAEDGGWAFIWRAEYHPQYGLAWKHVKDAQNTE